MVAYDLTLALTVHAETLVAGPTVQSAEKAVAAAEAAGFRIERLLGLDTATEACRRFFARPEMGDWDRHEFAFRDQGRARNALVAQASGRWLAFLDGDDLFSENWLLEALQLLQRADREGRRAIVHPELNWVFDAGSFVFTMPSAAEALFTPAYLATANYYDALCVAPRAAWLEHPYANRAVKEGFAFEDWQWGIETLQAGWEHIVAPETIIFKRRRDRSQTHESRENKVAIRNVDGNAIDEIQKLGSLGARGEV